MIVLFDFDSAVYSAVQRIVSIQIIRGWLKKGRPRFWMEQEIVNMSINRLLQANTNIFIAIEDTGIEISEVEYYLTVCKDSYRKKICSEYKAKRKKNKWVNMIRAKLIEMEFAIKDDQFEADDLIADRALELGPDKCLILSLDKDLKTIEGIHFDYYKPILHDENGKRKQSDYRGLSVWTKEESEAFFWEQMLVGDSVDNIKGVPGIGEKKANLIKKDRLNVFGAYETKFGMLASVMFQKNYELLRLGTKNRNLC